MILNQKSLLAYAPIKDMATEKISDKGVTYGLGEAGYDIRIAETVIFHPTGYGARSHDPAIATKRINSDGVQEGRIVHGRFVLASAMEEFQMTQDLVGVVHDKSTWARRGLSVFNTVIEPGWEGFLTLELVFHGHEKLVIPAGSGIAQVIFHLTTDPAQYSGRYQNQPTGPVEAKDAF